MRYRHIIFFILFLFPLLCYATESKKDSVAVLFSQDKQIRSWNTNAFFSSLTTTNQYYILNKNLLTQRFQKGYKSQWTTELSLLGNYRRQLGNHFRILTSFDAREYKDRSATSIVNPNNYFIYPTAPQFHVSLPKSFLGRDYILRDGHFKLGIEYLKNEWQKASFSAGIVSDVHDSLSGTGPSFSASGFFSNQDNLSLSTSGWLDKYNDHQNHYVFLQSNFVRSFSDAKNYLSLRYNKRRDDVYYANDYDYTSRLRDDYQINNLLVTPIGNNSFGKYELLYRNSIINNKNSDRGKSKELDFSNRFSYSFLLYNITNDIYYNYSIEDRTYRDNLILGKRQSIGLHSSLGTLTDSLHIIFNTQKLMYDSPSESDHSDRDRLIHRVNLRGKKEITKNSFFEFDALALLDHVVNLDANRSADNRWNRFMKLNPAIIWYPYTSFYNRIDFEVSANYTVYDYELSNDNNIRSNALRRWSFSDTLRVPINDAIRSIFSIRYDLEDRGRLDWDSFTQELSDEKRATFLFAGIERIFWSRISFTIGYKWQRREDDSLQINHEGHHERVPSSRYRVEGPTFRITSYATKRISVYGEAALLKVKNSLKKEDERLDTIHLIVSYKW